MTALRVAPRGYTAAQWTTDNPILYAREIGIEVDTQLFKFGNGVSPWNLLPYAGGAGHEAIAGVVIFANLTLAHVQITELRRFF